MRVFPPAWSPLALAGLPRPPWGSERGLGPQGVQPLPMEGGSWDATLSHPWLNEGSQKMGIQDSRALCGGVGGHWAAGGHWPELWGPFSDRPSALETRQCHRQPEFCREVFRKRLGPPSSLAEECQGSCVYGVLGGGGSEFLAQSQHRGQTIIWACPGRKCWQPRGSLGLGLALGSGPSSFSAPS